MQDSGGLPTRQPGPVMPASRGRSLARRREFYSEEAAAFIAEEFAGEIEELRFEF